LGVCASRNRKRGSRLSSFLVEGVVVDGFGDTSGVLSDERGDDASSCWCSFVMIVIVNGTADDLNEPSQAATRKKAANE